jgi:hypothetical protein
MALTNIQDKPIVIGQPVEIEFAVNEIRRQLAVLPWIDHPYFIAERFFRTKNGKKFVYPETYAPEKPGSRGYKRLTPDNDFDGMFFFMVGDGQNEFNANQKNFLTYPVGIIFSVNLERINSVKLDGGLFTGELIQEARRILTDTMMFHEFDYNIINETRDLRRVYQEFVLDDIEQYNRAPQQCFRINLNVRVEEFCDGSFPSGVPSQTQTNLEDRVEQLEENTDGFIAGTTPLEYYIFSREN